MNSATNTNESMHREAAVLSGLATMSSGTDTNSSATSANSPATNANSPAANANSSGADANSSATNADSSSYREASVVSGLAASVAAQLYSFFNDPQNYTHPMADDREPLAGCGKGKCPQYYYIAFGCYTAVALNLAAAVTAFILIDWKAKQAAKSRFVLDYMVNVGHVVWFVTFYLGLFMVVAPVSRYAIIEGKTESRWTLFFFLSQPALLFVAYLWTESANLASKFPTLWLSWRGTPASGSSEDTSPQEGANAPV